MDEVDARTLITYIDRAVHEHQRQVTDRICALKGGFTDVELAQWKRDYPYPGSLEDAKVKAVLLWFERYEQPRIVPWNRHTGTKPKGTCVECGREFALRSNGSVNAHQVRSGTTRCPGAHQYPRKES